MKNKKRVYAFGVLFILSTSFLFAFLFLIHHYPPLIPTTRWEVDAIAFSGSPVSVKTYRMLEYDEPLFILVDGGQDNPVYSSYYDHDYIDGKVYSRRVIDTRTQRWFTIFINDDRALITASVHPGTFLNINYNPASDYGIPILNGKHEERWFLSRVNGTVVFSNEVISVSVMKKTLPSKKASNWNPHCPLYQLEHGVILKGGVWE